jgi:excisionase family DNA binding protein
MTEQKIINRYLNDLLSKQQTAKMLGISISTLDRLMAAEKIEFYKLGLRRVAFDQRHIQNYLTNCTQNAQKQTV